GDAGLLPSTEERRRPRRARRAEDPRPPRHRGTRGGALGGDPAGGGSGRRAAGRPGLKRVADWLSLVKFSHSVFALPFALSGAWLAGGGGRRGGTLGWIVVCAVAARTAAMGFNRLVDREIDARNPRTRSRELPSGRLTPASVVALVLVASGVFVL